MHPISTIHHTMASVELLFWALGRWISCFRTSRINFEIKAKKLISMFPVVHPKLCDADF